MTDETPTPVACDDSTESFRPTSASQQHFVEMDGYRILQKLAEGGMGEVFEAEQLRPVRRRVALKLIKPGMDSREVLARFDTERQALAVLNHPNIAKVFDAGTTESGRPYFAMELVRGVPITEYCDTERLSPRERLELFVPICEGIQHAHQKGIIHRDIKPSNVLVALQDDQPIPKIIDFGIAKATAQPLTGRTVYTQLGRLIGTPEYMSPEQAEVSGLDIDTRTDIYSLGAVLYELLVGALPFEAETFRSGTLADIQRTIREREPPRPSTRAGSGEGSSVAAKRRRTDPAKLVKQLRGDLDWIVLKAMEKERTRRYETANALALDIRRHLQDEPVRARPPSTAYRLSKFVRRNKLTVAAASLVLLSILGGVVGTGLGLIRAREAEKRAINEAEAANEVSGFLVGLFEIADPSQAQGATITAREILNRGAARVERELSDRPLTQARMMHTIGDVHRSLGLYDEARNLLEKALALRDTLQPNSLEVAGSLDALAQLSQQTGDYAESQSRAEQALIIRESLLGPDHPKVAESLSRLGWALASAGHFDQAESRFRRALDIRKLVLDEDDPDLADSYQDLGIVFWRRSDYKQAEIYLEKALEILERSLGRQDFKLRATLNDLAVVHWSQGEFEEAETFFLRSLEIKERVLGPDHPEVASTLNNLAVLYDAQGYPEKAEPLLLRTLALKERTFGSDHDDVGMALGNLAWVYFRQGKFDEAEPLFRRARSIYEARLGPHHPALATLLRDHALLHVAQGQYGAAETKLKRSLAIRETSLGPDSAEVAECLHDLASLYVRQDRTGEAELLFERALVIRRAKLSPEHKAIAETEKSYQELLHRIDRGEQTEGLGEPQSATR